MRKLILVSFLCFSAPTFADSHKDVSNFFDNYIQLTNAYDATVAWLYSDSAKVHSYQLEPKGKNKKLELSGMQWKELISLIMPVNQAEDNKTQFSDIQISDYEDGFKITANRYVEAKCYTDANYYMVVKPNSLGTLEITEEYSGALQASACGNEAQSEIIAMQE